MIGVDADGVLFDYVGTAARWVNSRLGVLRGAASYETANSFDIMKSWGHSHLQPELDSFFMKTGVVFHMPVLEGAKDFLKKLYEIDDFVIVTSCPSSWHVEREQSLHYNFGIPRNRIIFSHDKSLHNLDALIDDCDFNFEGFFGKRILLDRPWNQNTNRYCYRAYTYDQALGVMP